MFNGPEILTLGQILLSRFQTFTEFCRSSVFSPPLDSTGASGGVDGTSNVQIKQIASDEKAVRHT